MSSTGTPVDITTSISASKTSDAAQGFIRLGAVGILDSDMRIPLLIVAKIAILFGDPSTGIDCGWNKPPRDHQYLLL